MAGGDPPVDVSVTHEGLDALVRAIRAEADGKELRKELAQGLRDALKPAIADARAGIMGMASAGMGTASPGLRTSIARRIRNEVKLGGRWSGARVKARKTPNIRGFANAAKRTQQDTWRTRIYKSDVWREQRGQLNWFDDAMHDKGHLYAEAIRDAMESMARRIASRIPPT
jgi:hypothetical protein